MSSYLDIEYDEKTDTYIIDNGVSLVKLTSEELDALYDKALIQKAKKYDGK
jgi:hypothetical protein